MADKIKTTGRKGYTVLQNDMITDRRLSLKTKGLAAVIFSRPDDWEFTIGGLAAYCGCGRDAVRSALAELEAAGYLTRKQLHGEGGVFAGNLYELHEGSNAAAADDQEVSTPSSENPTTVEQPLSGKPSADKPSTGNPTERNTDLKNYESKEPPYSPPKGGRSGRRKKKAPRDAPDWKPERFAKFWDYYPSEGRNNKQDAMKAWDDLRPNDELLKTIARALKLLMATDKWQRGIGIPYVGTFLRGARWEDAASLEPTSTQSDNQEVQNGWR